MIIKLLLIFALVYCVQCKNTLKSLTESAGKEIIEIGTPEKDLPPGIEEEPSPDVEEPKTAKPAQTPTKKDAKRTSTSKTTEKKTEPPKEELGSEEEEIKIEKEFADIYKDTDYKSDTEAPQEETSDTTIMEDEQKALRLRSSFKFQPDSANRNEIERFRTSVDEISCEKRVTQRLSAEVRNVEDSGAKILEAYFFYIGLSIMVLIAL